MANNVVCAELKGDIDLSCTRDISKGYEQEAVIINKNDIDRTASVEGDINDPCDYTVQMLLKTGKKGVQLKLPDTSVAVKGFFAKSLDANGNPQYLHQVQIQVFGSEASVKCILDKLDRGKYVVAVQTLDGIVEVYGWKYGLSTADYTYDIVEGVGGATIILQIKENAQETKLPMVYKPQTGGDADADFNSQFAA
ncbi:hypothetical protein [Elizabethkingia sp. M8]|uniref:hypothetical protein n=1 Tax=Elizabethkingia sp. M8 TaxID=2796140 RepID=UPI001902CF5A|nr:hypothetical protein [Elizabethkingia sp. M8]QQM25260.1 hypothetical protein JCR23_10105 [Elizabethkingia sp. M8]